MYLVVRSSRPTPLTHCLITRPRLVVYVPSRRYPGTAVRARPSFQSWKVAPTWTRQVGVGPFVRVGSRQETAFFGELDSRQNYY